MRAEKRGGVVPDPPVANPEPPVALVQKVLDLDFVLSARVSVDVIGGENSAGKDQGVVLDPT